MPCFEGSPTGTLWYDDSGSGTPIIFIHGWCMSSVIWALQKDLHNHSFRIITLDLPGHGQSPPPANAFSIADCAIAVTELCSYLNIRHALLAGWSLGSLVALECASLLRDRLSGLILIAGTPRFARVAGFDYGLSPVEVDGMALKVKRNIRRALDGFTMNMFAPDELDQGAVTIRINGILSAVPLLTSEVALQALRALVETDLRERLPAIDLPVLIITGDADPICLPQASQYMADRIRSAYQVVFKGCGHAPFLTQSARFNETLIDFNMKVDAREN